MFHTNFVNKIHNALRASSHTADKRVLVRINGIDYAVDNVILKHDGILGDYLVIETKPLDL